MRADYWNFAIALGLFVYLAWGIRVGRRLKEPGVLFVIVMLPVWTIVGAFSIISAKRTDQTARSSYLEDVMFPVELDPQYAVALVMYFAFAFIFLGLLTLTKPADKESSLRNRQRIVQLCLDFPIPLATLLLVAGLGVQLVLIQSVSSDLGLNTLYNAGRNEQVSPGLLRLLTYVKITTLGMLSVAITSAVIAATYRTGATRIVVPLVIFLPLVVLQYRVNLVLGDRGTMFIAAFAVMIGVARFGRAGSLGGGRFFRRIIFWLVAVSALYFVAVIGLLRRVSTSGGGIRGGVLDAALQPAAVIGEFFGGAELAAAHMSLYGLLRFYEPSGVVVPFIDSTYEAYASALMFPETQGFTIHLVSAWYVIAGVAAPLLAALYFAGLVWVMVWIGRRDVTKWNAALVFTATTWAMSVLPVAVLRSGPEGLRGTLTAALVLPTLASVVLWWGAHRREERRLRRSPSPRSQERSGGLVRSQSRVDPKVPEGERGLGAPQKSRPPISSSP